jgi:D-sedoheptulose 7-phosphate isomerase
MSLYNKKIIEFYSTYCALKSIERQVEDSAIKLLEILKNGGKIFIAGNAGAGSNAEHFVSELVGRFYKNRKGIPAISLNSDNTTITCIANDFGFDSIFERQLEALFNLETDIFIGMSTSGNSQNIIRATEYLNEIGGKSIILLGKDGGKNSGLESIYSDMIVIPYNVTPRIQEAHMFILHYWAEYIESNLFGKVD